MATGVKFYLVSSDVLPAVFLKVAEANRMLRAGEVKTVGAAARAVDISRSAYYKYKDAIQPFIDKKAGRIVTFYALLQDRLGVLSSVLSLFAAFGANILTINQSIPVNGCATVTISSETADMTDSTQTLMNDLLSAHGVLRAEVVAG